MYTGKMVVVICKLVMVEVKALQVVVTNNDKVVEVTYKQVVVEVNARWVAVRNSGKVVGVTCKLVVGEGECTGGGKNIYDVKVYFFL